MARKTQHLSFCITLFYVALKLVVLTLSAPQSALITKLPGFNGAFPSKHYGGYVTVDDSHGRKLYYYFVVSERNPSKDPVVLWLNGGPGCSSFDGFVYEHGPFRFEKGKPSNSLPTLRLNPYSWSKVSNIIYLDSPSGVGLSYSKNESDYETGDIKTALDTHSFLLQWFKLYPEFLSNPFYITGESYAGIYVPTLAKEVLKGIGAGVKPVINFKGYMVGNPLADDVFDGNSLVPFTHGMGLISDDLYQTANSDCQGNFYNSTSQKCDEVLSKIDEVIEDVNIYNILEPCYNSPNPLNIPDIDTVLPQSFRITDDTQSRLPLGNTILGRAWPFRAPVRDGFVPTLAQALNGLIVPCTDVEVATAWLNIEAVRKAIHGDPVKLAGPWVLCTGRINFTHDTGSMMEYHKNLTLKGYRALVFSGDHDMRVPFTGTQAWTRAIGYKIVDEWRPWYVNEQVAGFLQGYEHNLTFLTIKGAGHTVPQYKPQEALEFYTRWLDGKKI